MNKCYATIILDRSGSMQAIKQEAIDFFNGQLTAIKEGTALTQDQEDQKAPEGRKIRISEENKPSQKLEVVVSLVTFSEHVDQVVWLQPVDKVSPLISGDYICQGTTALYDAIAETIKGLEQADEEEEGKHLVIVVTDGEENSSRRFVGEGGRIELKQMIQKLKDTGRWTFAFLGSGQDLPELQQSLGMSAGNMYGAAGARGPTGREAFAMASGITREATVSFLQDITEGGVCSSDDFYGAHSLANTPELKAWTGLEEDKRKGEGDEEKDEK